MAFVLVTINHPKNNSVMRLIKLEQTAKRKISLPKSIPATSIASVVFWSESVEGSNFRRHRRCCRSHLRRQKTARSNIPPPARVRFESPLSSTGLFRIAGTIA